MLQSLIRWRSPAGPRARLSTLIFHRVLSQADPLFPHEVHAQRFDQICGWIARWFNVLPLDQAARRLAEGSLPERAAAITFDDGYADNAEVALPILQRHGLCATFFVATGFLNGGRMWNDSLIESVRRCPGDGLDLGDTPAQALGRLPLTTIAQRREAALRLIGAAKYLSQPERAQWVEAVARRSGATLPDDLMMRDDQLLRLRDAGMQIGGHTVTHPILARLQLDEVRREIAQGRDDLQRLLGQPVRLFAYPNGKPSEDYQTQAVDIVRELGFDAAVTTAWGAAGTGSDLFQLPRFTPWDRARVRFGLRLAWQLTK
ncbi:polysaccharide deacetylase family protein [Ideonella sp. DXS22W]|uniref:Polysaccharide deacetylase family protein n=1 Tax=Pseudaquabacterium inlustre TaxID=2984192 RepID=A0ABU9CRE9_9BURK